MFARMPSTLLVRATLASPPDPVDVRIRGGLIVDVGDLAPLPDDEVIDLEGRLLLAAAVEPHAHLDKAFLAETIDNPTGDLHGAIDAMDATRDGLDIAGTIERAERAARLMAANGYRAVRTHADVVVGHGLTSVEALLEVRRRVADVIDVTIVALAGWPLLGRAGADQRALLRDAIGAGVDVVGGCPHLEDTGTRAPTEFLVDLAAEHRLPVDLHTDETLDPAVLGLLDLVEMVEAGFPHAATASHCVSLGMQPARRQREIAERVAAADVSVVVLPHTNLYLQGRGRAPMPRGLTAVDALRSAGATVAAGADNLQDPFNPLGRACPFETAGLMIIAAHLLPLDAWNSVTDAAGAVVGVGAATVAPGGAADLVAIAAGSLREAIATGSHDRMVWRAGRLVAAAPTGR
jgi:cytosine deaminase